MANVANAFVHVELNTTDVDKAKAFPRCVPGPRVAKRLPHVHHGHPSARPESWKAIGVIQSPFSRHSSIMSLLRGPVGIRTAEQVEATGMQCTISRCSSESMLLTRNNIRRFLPRSPVPASKGRSNDSREREA